MSSIAPACTYPTCFALSASYFASFGLCFWSFGVIFLVSFGLRPVSGREQKKHWIGVQVSGISKCKTSERWVVYLVTSSVKSKKQTLIYIAWTRCLIHCMDALLTPAGRKRCGPSGSSEQWDRVAVQKVALLTPAGRKRCSLFFRIFGYIQSKTIIFNHASMVKWIQAVHTILTLFFLSLCLNLLPKRKAIRSLESGGHPGISMLRLVFSELAEASFPSLVKISRGHAEIKLETCWLCKWNIKMEFLKVPPPRSSIFEEGGWTQQSSSKKSDVNSSAKLSEGRCSRSM